jgi:predicted metal-dependent phosphoesterase TrpH
MQMPKKQELAFLMEAGALVLQAHPFRESGHIDHIRLFPRSVHGVEIINSSRPDFENDLARQYADNYGLLYFAGSDNHIGSKHARLAGVGTDTPIVDENDFIERVKSGKIEIFAFPNPTLQ